MDQNENLKCKNNPFWNIYTIAFWFNFCSSACLRFLEASVKWWSWCWSLRTYKLTHALEERSWPPPVGQFRSNYFIELDQFQRSYSFPPAHFSQMSFKAVEMKALNLLHCKLCLVGSNQSHLQFKLKKWALQWNKWSMFMEFSLGLLSTSCGKLSRTWGTVEVVELRHSEWIRLFL